MNLLFKREQTARRVGGVQFKLWAKVELEDDEKSIISRYRFDQTVLIYLPSPGLLRAAIMIGLLAFLVVAVAANTALPTGLALAVGVAAGGGVGYWWFHEKRETLYVRDLMHGRHFTCPSVIDLAHKEEYLRQASGVLRQVMESAKHWDGTETIAIKPLPAEQAKLLMLRAT